MATGVLGLDLIMLAVEAGKKIRAVFQQKGQWVAPAYVEPPAKAVQPRAPIVPELEEDDDEDDLFDVWVDGKDGNEYLMLDAVDLDTAQDFAEQLERAARNDGEDIDVEVRKR